MQTRENAYYGTYPQAVQSKKGLFTNKKQQYK